MIKNPTCRLRSFSHAFRTLWTAKLPVPADLQKPGKALNLIAPGMLKIEASQMQSLHWLSWMAPKLQKCLSLSCVCVSSVCVWIKWWLDEGGSCGNVVQGFCVSAACESFHFPGSGFFHSDSTSHYHQLTAIWSPTNAECDGFEVKAVDAQYNVQPESIEPFGTFSLARPRDMHIYAYVYDCLCIFVQTHCLWWSEAEMQRQSAYGCRNEYVYKGIHIPYN